MRNPIDFLLTIHRPDIGATPCWALVPIGPTVSELPDWRGSGWDRMVPPAGLSLLALDARLLLEVCLKRRSLDFARNDCWRCWRRDDGWWQDDGWRRDGC